MNDVFYLSSRPGDPPPLSVRTHQIDLSDHSDKPREPVTGWEESSPVTVGSFDNFYQAERDNVAKTLSLILGDDELGHEAADEAMSRAYERWSTVSTYGNPEGWVYRTGLNWARSWLRRRKLGATKDVLVAVDGRVVDQQPNTDVAAAIAQLPHKYRAVVVLRYYRDWSVEQTAEALDIAPGTVKSRLSRALEKLEHELAEDPTGSPSQTPTDSPTEGGLR